MQDATADKKLYLSLSQTALPRRQVACSYQQSDRDGGDIRNRIQAVDQSQAVADSVSLEQVVADRRPRTAMLVVVMFAGSALLLAAVGIYGVIAYSVGATEKRNSIRMASEGRYLPDQSDGVSPDVPAACDWLDPRLPLAMVLSRLYGSS
jgi:hypothetical protein